MVKRYKIPVPKNSAIIHYDPEDCDVSEYVEYKDYAALEAELAMCKGAHKISFESDGCIFPERKCPKPKREWPHDCYGCYIEQASKDVK